jgi:hypothetical protein
VITAERYVPTATVRQAVAGREGDVLDALHIAWRTRGHIKCPYPSHGGEADWRWDEKHSKARCTCSKSDSIFDVVMKVEARDFEAAKVRTAEILGRHDLIRTKGSDSSKYQATDARSLLNQPITATTACR